MTRHLRLALAAGFLVATVLAGAAISGAEEGSQPGPDTSGTATADLLSCIATSQRVALVVLLDQSRSLDTSDREGSRVQLGQSIVASLRAIASITVDGEPSRLDVLVAGFGTSVTDSDGGGVDNGDWVQVDDSTFSTVMDQVESFRTRKGDEDTDYVDALAVAESLLAQRAVEMAPAEPETVCRAIAWFTDGQFDLTQGGLRRWWAQDLPLGSRGQTEQAEQRGIDLLCRSGGLADQLRSSRTHLFTFALLGEKFSGEQEVLLKQVTLGEPACGEVSATGLGQYFGETAVGDMVCAYLAALAGRDCSEGDPPTTTVPSTAESLPPTISTPPSAPCSAASPCRREVKVDSAVGAFTAVVEATPDLTSTVLISPDGERIPLDGSVVQASPSGSDIAIVKSGGSALVTSLFPPDSSADGTWVIEHGPPGGGDLTATVELRSAYHLRLLTPQALVRTQSAEATLNIVDAGDNVVPFASFAATPDVRVEVRDGGALTAPELGQGSTADALEFPILLDPLGQSPSVEVDVNGTATTSDGRVLVLPPLSATVPVSLPGLPRPPDRIRLGALVAQRAPERDARGVQAVEPIDTSFEGTTFVGDPQRDGRACLDGVDAIGANQTIVELTAAQPCVDVPAGSTVRFPLAVRIAGPVAGPVSGSARFVLSASGEELTQAVSVPVDGSVIVPLPDPYIDSTVLWWLFAVAVLVPALVYLAFAWWSACFSNPASIMVIERDARVTAAGVELLGTENHSIDEVPTYLTGSARPSRSTACPRVRFRAPIRLLRLPSAVAESVPPGAPVFATGGAVSGANAIRRRKRAALAHRLQGEWVFLPTRSTQNGAVDGSLILLLNSQRVDIASRLDPTRPSALIDELVQESSIGLATQFGDIRQSVSTDERIPEAAGASRSRGTRYSSHHRPKGQD